MANKTMTEQRRRGRTVTEQRRRGRSRVRSRASTTPSSNSKKKVNIARPRNLSSLSRKHHSRTKSIKKEQRLLYTWNKIEIANWLQKHWIHHNDSPQLLRCVNKIKRDKKFDGKYVHKLDDRYLNILALRCLGLKKGSPDYKLFIHSMRLLHRTYCGKKKRKLHKSRYRTPPHKKKKNKHLSKFPFSTNSYPESYLNAQNILRRSSTSPATEITSDDDEKLKFKYGVTADELLNLISCGQCDSDYDYESDEKSTAHDVQQYIYQNTAAQTPSPKDVVYKKSHLKRNKTTVVSSILTVSDQETICLSPIAAKNGDTLTFNMLCYSMTDESTDDEEEIVSFSTIANKLPPDIISILHINSKSV